MDRCVDGCVNPFSPGIHAVPLVASRNEKKKVERLNWECGLQYIDSQSRFTVCPTRRDNLGSSFLPLTHTAGTTSTRHRGRTHTGTMHSKLDLHQHISCEDIIVEFDRCHSESILNRYLGRCNQLKRAMNECLQVEV
jgi:hypothetical protein